MVGRVVPGPSDIAQRKDELRRRLLGARRARSPSDRAAAAHTNAAHLVAALDGTGVVCAYLPLPSEPLTADLLDTLVAAGTTVLVPVVAADAPLDWCRYPSPTADGPFGIHRPIGPRLGSAAVRTADAVLLPAFAVDRAGHRLGRGGGHYDRTLDLLDARRSGSGSGPGSGSGSVALIAVLFDDEIVADLPVGGHDQDVTAAVTPTAGIEYLRS